MESGVKITFNNNEKLHELMITIPRESNQVETVSNQVGAKSNQVGAKSDQESSASNQVREDLETKSNQVEKKGNQVELTNKQKDIVNYCTIPRSAAEIMARIGVSNQSKNRKRHIVKLVENGYLELTNPENPNASNQKYRKVQK